MSPSSGRRCAGLPRVRVGIVDVVVVADGECSEADGVVQGEGKVIREMWTVARRAREKSSNGRWAQMILARVFELIYSV